MKPNNLDSIHEEFTKFILLADPILKDDYVKYKQYVAETTPDNERLTILPYPAFCFGIYVEASNDLDMDEKIKDLLR